MTDFVVEISTTSAADQLEAIRRALDDVMDGALRRTPLLAAWHDYHHAYFQAPRTRTGGLIIGVVPGTLRPVFEAMSHILDAAGLGPRPWAGVRLVPGGCERCDR